MERTFASLTERLPQSSFSFAMSTGIVSISALLHDWDTASEFLFFIGFAGLIALAFLFLARAALRPGGVLRELHDPRYFFGFFTISAGIDVISARLMLSYIQGYDYLLFSVSLGLLFLFIALFASLVATGRIPFRAIRVTSSWLNVPVALEASAISASIYFQETAPAPEPVYLLLFGLVISGLVSYAMVNISEIGNILIPGKRHEFSGTFFINMGAAAIFSLASMELLRVDSPAASQGIQNLLSAFFLGGGIYATVWLPIVFFRYIKAAMENLKAKYNVEQWAIIFPLGMFSVTTHYLSRAYPFQGFFEALSFSMFAVALFAWAVEGTIAALGIVRLSMN